MLLNPESFKNGTSVAFKKMLGWDIEFAIKKLQAANIHTEGDMSAITGLTYEKKGTVVLALCHPLAAKICKEINQIDKEIDESLISDTMKELLNIIAGQSKKKSNIKFQFTLPSVKVSNEYINETLQNQEITWINGIFENEQINLLLGEE